MRIAIVGTGIAGNVCGYLLHREHDIAVFEAGGRIGGHTETHDIEIDGERHAVDTGFIVFNEHYYPNFVKLLARLNVASQPTRMGFSVQSGATGLEYAGASLDGLFAQRRNLIRPAHLRMLWDLLRFQREGLSTLAGIGDETTVEEYVASNGYSRQFADDFLLPLGSALWSSPLARFRRFPIRFVIEFLANHGMMQVFGRPDWRVVQGGSSRYVQPLTAGFQDRIRLRCAVRRAHRDAGGVTVVSDAGPERFDHLILACHADQALAIVGNPSPAEREILGHFPYERNDTVLHTDASVLPKNRRAWASWNYRLVEAAEVRAAVTYNMNILQGIRSRHIFCVSLNEPGINPKSVLRRITYHHPIFRPGRANAQRRHAELIGNDRISYCGASWGFGFHEDGVRSALAVCGQFGARLE